MLHNLNVMTEKLQENDCDVSGVIQALGTVVGVIDRLIRYQKDQSPPHYYGSNEHPGQFKRQDAYSRKGLRGRQARAAARLRATRSSSDNTSPDMSCSDQTCIQSPAVNTGNYNPSGNFPAEMGHRGGHSRDLFGDIVNNLEKVADVGMKAYDRFGHMLGGNGGKKRTFSPRGSPTATPKLKFMPSQRKCVVPNCRFCEPAQSNWALKAPRKRTFHPKTPHQQAHQNNTSPGSSYPSSYNSKEQRNTQPPYAHSHVNRGLNQSRGPPARQYGLMNQSSSKGDARQNGRHQTRNFFGALGNAFGDLLHV